MAEIEPIKLDMGLFQTAMMMQSHQQNLAESMRHHAELESATQERVSVDALENVLKNPDFPITQKYSAAQQLYKIATKGQGEPLPPMNYNDHQGQWNAFLTTLTANGASSPEATAAMQQLVQTDPWARQQAEQAMKRQQSSEQVQGLRSMPIRAGQPALTLAEGEAVQASPNLQKQLGETAFPSGIEAARTQEVKAKTEDLKLRESTLSRELTNLNTYSNPILDLSAEDEFRSRLGSGAQSPLDSISKGFDIEAARAGTLNRDQRQQAKSQLQTEMTELGNKRQQLQQELRKARSNVDGTARPPEQIQAEQQAISDSLNIKHAEYTYLSENSTSALANVKKAYANFEKKTSALKDQILRVRAQGSAVAQGALNERIEQNRLTHEYHTRLIDAQAKFAQSGSLTPASAGKIAQEFNVETADVLKGGEEPNKPKIAVNLPDISGRVASEEFMKSTRTTYDQLKNAPAQLKNLAEAKALIPKAKGFMGPGGESLLEASKFLNNRLGMSINTEGIKSAEELRSRIFFNVMDNLKKMDAQPSQMQQIIMMDALGKLGTDPQALVHVLDAYEDSIRNKIEVHNTEVEGAMKQGHVQFPYDPRIKIPKDTRVRTVAPEPVSPVAPFNDPEKEKRYQEFKKKHQ